MKSFISPLVLLAAAIAAPLSAQEGDEPSIVVTGTPLETTLKALEDCLARGCPPEEDIRLSLAHAENLFVEGDYRDARSTLLGSLKRTKSHGDDLPVPVSDLYRANARIAEHLGEGKAYQLSTLEVRDTLQSGLGAEDPRTLIAEIAVGDSRAKLGQPDDAERIYERVEERAIELGQPRVAMYARIRQALLWQARFDAEKRDWQKDRMLAAIAEIRENPLPGAEEFALIGEVMQAKLDRSEGQAASTEALIRRFAEKGGVDRPVLLYSEPLLDDAARDREAARADSASARLSTASLNEPRWADVGFWIEGDGHVSGVEVLRAQGGTDWLKPIAQNIAKRVYAPLSDKSASAGFYMIERYTLTARFADQTTGTRMRKREPQMRIERIDLTPENYGQPVEG